MKNDLPQPRVYSTKLIIGLIIICLGLLFLAGNLGLISAAYVLRNFWPVALIVVGILMITQKESRKGKQWGWVWLLVGIWVLGDRLDWIDVSVWQLFFP